MPTFGPGVVFDVDIKIRTEQIRFFTESLKTSKLQSYVPQFVMEAEVCCSSRTSAFAALLTRRQCGLLLTEGLGAAQDTYDY